MAGKHVFKGNRVYILAGPRGKREWDGWEIITGSVGSYCGILPGPAAPGRAPGRAGERVGGGIAGVCRVFVGRGFGGEGREPREG